MLAGSRSGRGTPTIAAPTKGLIWSDEFNGSVGSLPSSANWAYEIGRGTSGWGNNELEYYTNSSRNVSLDGNSNLQITAYHETTPDNINPSTPGDTAYTSARIKTQGLREFSPPCKIMARMFVPWTLGLWPAFWTLGHSTTTGYTGWPAEGEIDIGEWGLGGFPTLQGNLHVGQVGSLSTNIGINATNVNYEYLPSRWNIYSLDWYTDRLTWHIDGQIIGTVTQAQTTAANGDWTPMQGSWPQYLIINMAVGGTATPTAASAFPQTMLIDWVRVYNI